MARAVFGEVQMSLFVAGALFGEVQVSLFVARAVLDEVQLSLFAAGAVFCEIWDDSRSAKCCIFPYKMLMTSAKSNLGCAGGCGLTGFHARIMLGTVSERFVLRTVSFPGRGSIW